MGRSRWLSVLLASTLLFSSIPRPAAGADPVFGDVVGTSFEQPVMALAALGIVRGASETAYDPHGPVTRSQMAALWVRALRLSRPPEAEPIPQRFADVPPDFWGFEEIALALEAGIVTGTATDLFSPNDHVTLGQATAMAVRALGYENGRLAYPEGYQQVAEQLDLLHGLNWEPNRPLTRGESAVLLANAVFRVEHGALGRTLSQAYYRHAVALRILPEMEALATGTTQLSAVGTDAYGNELPVLPAQWRVLEGPGTVTENGLLTAAPGALTVAATVGNLTTTASYRIVPSLAVVPSSGLFQPGDSVHLRAVMELTQDNVPDATWRVLSGPGAITESGLLSFLAPGNVVVEASLGTSRAKATLTAANLLRLHPASATMAPGETRTFTVVGPDGRPLPGPFEWRVNGAGSITPDGVYTAAAGARTTVQVRAGELMGAAPIQVVDKLEITTAHGGLTTHKSVPVQLQATGLISHPHSTTDSPMPTGPPSSTTAPEATAAPSAVPVTVTWSLSGPGSVDASGLFTPRAPGPVQVTARYGSVAETITITVADDPARVTLEADRESVPANGASPVRLTATVLDAQGTVVSGLESTLRFSLSGPGAATVSEPEVRTTGGTATVTWTPGKTAGTYAITVAGAGQELTPGALQITATAAAPGAIRLSVDPASIPALPESKATVTAILLDAEGHEIANPTNAPITVALGALGAQLTPPTLTIDPGQSRGTATLLAGAAGEIVITGRALYPVEATTVRTTAVGAGRLTIQPITESVLADGTSVMTVTVAVHDLQERPLLDPVTVTLTATSADGRTALPVQRAPSERGLVTFHLKTTKAGAYTLTAASPGLVGDAENVTFRPGAPIGLRLTAYPTPYLRADGSSKLLLRAELVDRQGNVATGATTPITLTRVVNGGATTGVTTATVTAQGGVAEWELTASHSAGTDGFRASADSLGESQILYVFTQN